LVILNDGVLNHDELTRMTVSLWAIWYARRKLIHEGINQSPYAMLNFVINFIAELDQLSARPEPPLQTAPAQANQNFKWIPPVQGSMKINVDAAISTNHNVGTAAAVCRDSDGAYLGSSMLVIHGLLDPPMLEAIACRESLSLAQDLGMVHLHLASDCKQVVHHIHQRDFRYFSFLCIL
jgi:hypothetical protein